jgi:diaminobutyrate-2-oxoglutarate transaminase
MSMGALAATGSKVHREGLEDSLQNVVRLPFDGYCHAGATELDRFAEMTLDPSGGIQPIAAIIVETVQGEGGLNVASDRWLRALRDVAYRIGALLIVDDIQTGCGRTGQFLSFERAGIVPDIVCLSKSIGAGFPMSLLLVRPEFDTWRPGEHNGTFRGNGLAFVAGTAALELWCAPEFVAGIQERSDLLANWSNDMVNEFPALVSRGKGTGMMMGLEFVSPQAAALVAERARNLSVIVERCGPRDEVIKILAPLNIEFDLFQEGLNRLRAAIGSVARSAVSQPQAA